jgi:hypothetical protein
MNTSCKTVTGIFVVMLLGAFQTAFAQQTLTVSPTVTSNTYPGVITLTITGLTNGEQVAIQEFMDLNANGQRSFQSHHRRRHQHQHPD